MWSGRRYTSSRPAQVRPVSGIPSSRAPVERQAVVEAGFSHSRSASVPVGGEKLGATWARYLGELTSVTVYKKQSTNT